MGPFSLTRHASAIPFERCSAALQACHLPATRLQPACSLPAACLQPACNLPASYYLLLTTYKAVADPSLAEDALCPELRRLLLGTWLPPSKVGGT